MGICVLDGLGEGVTIWDGGGRLRYFNAAARRQFGDDLRTDLPCELLTIRCSDEAEALLGEADFPVRQVLTSGRAAPQTTLRIRHGDGAGRWLRLTAQPRIGDESTGPAGVVCHSVDVTDLIEQQRQMTRHAHYDGLTRLPNRRLLADRMAVALARARRRGETLAVCQMDLDGFKPINDTLGHAAGDRLLAEVSRRLSETVRGDDTAARVGGDEFVLLLGGLESSGQCEQILKRILGAVAVPCMLGNDEVKVSASLGVTLYPNDRSLPDELLRHADQALYRAKEAGRNRFHFYDPVEDSRLQASREIPRRIDAAVRQNQFRLFYQPIVDCRQGCVAGLEALIRWDHPVLGHRQPGEFLPLIEAEDAILRVGDWVLAAAVAQLAAWREVGIDLPISLNISARQLLHDGFVDSLAQRLQRQAPGIAERLEIDIGEPTALTDINGVAARITALHGLGLRIALDDFGTGFSSLAHLRRLPADTLKIDQGFVHDLSDDAGARATVAATMGLAKAFGQRVVAEGVETIEQIMALLALGCDLMQGFALCRPLPAAQIPEWLDHFRADPRWRAADAGYPRRIAFELLQLEVLHGRWLAQQLDGRKSECRLCAWITQAARRRCGSMAEFRALESGHRLLHELADGSREDDDARHTIAQAGADSTQALQALRGRLQGGEA